MRTTITDAAPLVRAHRMRRRRRVVLVTVVLAAIAFGLFVLTMMIGSFPLTAWEVVASTFRLREDPSVDFIVHDLRLPVAAAALGVGLALGAAGSTFQKLLANPLASPDFVGISSGASLFAVASIILFHASSAWISGSALAGALLSSALIYLLAWKDGISGYRFILIGIGVSEFLLSIAAYLIARADLYDAREAMTWLVGSVGQAGPGELRTLLVTLVVLLPAAMLLDRPLRALELGDDAAKALGTRVEPARLGLIAVAIVLVAFATAVAGPIMFVALVSGPIARRLLGPTSGGLPASAFVGAIVVLGADLVTQHLLPVALPTGVVTGAIGAPYLIWLLITVNREGRGG
ncbi:FecCD family ABC transporter permease [Flindersiella endophytica]